MKIKLKELYSIVEGKNEYDLQKKRLFGLTLLMVENVKLAKNRIETFEQARDEILKSDRYKDFQDGRNEIIDSHKKKDKNGNFEITTAQGRQSHNLFDVPVMQAKLEAFDKEHKPLIDEMNEHSVQIDKELQSKIEIPLKKIMKIDYVNALSIKALVFLAPIIGVPLTEKLLGDKADELKSSDAERLIEFCKLN